MVSGMIGWYYVFIMVTSNRRRSKKDERFGTPCFSLYCFHFEYS